MKPEVPLAERGLDALPLVFAGLVAGRVLLAFAGRFDHPFDLEWMEGGMLAHAWRLQHGLPLYVAPNPDFVPYIYPPGYSALLAGLGALFGLDYALGRVLSVIGTLAAAAAIPFVAVRQTGSWVGGLCGGAVYLGLFRASGGFYDLVRPDAIGMALVAWSVALALERRRGAEIASGLLLCLAFLFKHNLAAFGAPLVIGLALRGPWSTAAPVARRFVLASAGPALVATALLQLGSSGRFLVYLLEVPRSHPMLWDRLSRGVAGELGVWLMPTLWFVVAWIAATARLGRRPWAWGLVAWLGLAPALWASRYPRIQGVDMGEPWVAALALVALGAAAGIALSGALLAVGRWRGAVEGPAPSWRWVMAVGIGGLGLLLAGLMRAHYGGFMNVLMPAHWVLALGLAVGVGHVRQRFASPSPLVRGVTMLVLTAQLGWIHRRLDTVEVVPTPAQVVAGRAVQAALAEHCPEGRILSPHFAWLPTRLGRPPSVPLISLWDLNHEHGPFERQVRVAMARAVRDHHWACVLDAGGRGLGYGIDEAYEQALVLQPPATELRPMTGWRVRPGAVLVPRGSE